jgi:4-amino-4-deoxychorismate lyase
MYLSINGKLVSKEDAYISAFDHGFLYGIGLFETFRVYNGHAFLLDDHLNRLNDSLKQLLINVVITKDKLIESLTILLRANGLENAYIRLNVSAGLGEIGLQVESYENPNVIIFAKSLPPVSSILQEKRAQLLSIRRNSPEGDYRLKSHHFLNNLLAKREVGSELDVEGIFLNADGFLAEGVVSNLFWVKGQTLFTPSVETGILNGITRQFIITLARSCGYDVIEGLYTPEDLLKAEEIFITNSIQEIVGISQFGERDYPGKKGKLSGLLLGHYRRYCLNLYSRNELK